MSLNLINCLTKMSILSSQPQIFHCYSCVRKRVLTLIISSTVHLVLLCAFSELNRMYSMLVAAEEGTNLVESHGGGPTCLPCLVHHQDHILIVTVHAIIILLFHIFIISCCEKCIFWSLLITITSTIIHVIIYVILICVIIICVILSFLLSSSSSLVLQSKNSATASPSFSSASSSS